MGKISTFGQRLKAARLLAGLSQNELAKRAKVNRVAITLLENGGQSTIGVDRARRLADVLGISLDTLTREGPLPERKREADLVAALA